jgi:hypothetical protein
MPCITRLAAAIIVVAFLTPALAAKPNEAAVPVVRAITPPTPEQIGYYGLEPKFYKKALVVQGILIATSDRVSDVCILEGGYLFDTLLDSINPEVAARVREKKLLCLLLAHDERTSDLPHFQSDLTGEALDFSNWRKRGFLDTVDVDGRKQPVVVFAEEDVLEYPGGMQDESILIHEFGHVVMFQGFDDEQMKRVTACFENARDEGLYMDGYAAQRFERIKGPKPVRLLDALAESFPDQPRTLLVAALAGGAITVNGKPTTPFIMVDGDDKILIHFGGPKDCYALQNRAEYFAEIFQAWYDTNRTMDHDHNHIHTREQLKEYDPMGAAFCAEVLGDGPWRFVSPRLRAGTGHLSGYDPAKAPKVLLRPNIEMARLDHFDKYWSGYWKRLHEKYPR